MILVLRFGRLGDFLVGLPALDALRRRFPGEKIILLTAVSSQRCVVKTSAGYIASDAPPPWVDWVCPRWVDEVLLVRSFLSISEWGRLRRRLSKMEAISACYVLGFHGDTKRSIWKKRVWLRSLGLRGPIFDLGRTAPSSRPLGFSWQMMAPLNVVLSCPSPLNVQPKSSELPRLELGLASEAWVEAFAPEGGFRKHEGGYVAFFPSGTHAHKCWPVERFSEVARVLIRHGVKLVFVGAAQDRRAAGAVIAQLPGDAIVDLCGKTDLNQLSSVLRRCRFFVGNDGGVAHLAAAVGIPTCTIMSGVHLPGVWDPSVANGVAIRAQGLSCFGCGAEFSCPQGHCRCVLDIVPAEVERECVRLLRFTSKEGIVA